MEEACEIFECFPHPQTIPYRCTEDPIVETCVNIQVVFADCFASSGRLVKPSNRIQFNKVHVAAWLQIVDGSRCFLPIEAVRVVVTTMVLIFPHHMISRTHCLSTFLRSPPWKVQVAIFQRSSFLVKLKEVLWDVWRRFICLVCRLTVEVVGAIADLCLAGVGLIIGLTVYF